MFMDFQGLCGLRKPQARAYLGILQRAGRFIRAAECPHHHHRTFQQQEFGGII
jgi:hypothetical protein